MPEYPAAPECDRMLAVKDESQRYGEFLEWLQHRYTLCRPPTGIKSSHYRPALINIEKILADYFDIDLEEAEREKRAILAHLRERNATG